jgi:hypothetical protein
VADGVPDNVVRTVTENSRQLKFTSHGFETDECEDQRSTQLSQR